MAGWLALMAIPLIFEGAKALLEYESGDSTAPALAAKMQRIQAQEEQRAQRLLASELGTEENLDALQGDIGRTLEGRLGPTMTTGSVPGAEPLAFLETGLPSEAPPEGYPPGRSPADIAAIMRGPQDSMLRYAAGMTPGGYQGLSPQGGGTPQGINPMEMTNG